MFFVIVLPVFTVGVVMVSFRIWMKVTSGKFEISTDLTGKNFYITGSSSGLGMETARELAKHNGRVYMLVRTLDRGQKLAEELKQETGNSQIFVLECNLSSLKNVRKCAEKILKSGEHIDVLLNNAGMGGSTPVSREKTEDGLNQLMQSNHFGHFLLTNLLLDRIKSNPKGARIVNVSSLLHLHAPDFDINDLNYENQTSKDNMFRLYAWSKLANVLFTRELAKVLEGSKVTTNSLHPGAIITDINKLRDGTGIPGSYAGILQRFFAPIFRPIIKTANEGIQTHLYLSISPEVNNVSGHYFADCKPAVTALNGLDDKLAAQLWEKSVGFTKM